MGSLQTDFKRLTILIKMQGKHIIKRVKGYITKSGKYLYRCSCGKEITAWRLSEAYPEHRKDSRFSGVNENSIVGI